MMNCIAADDGTPGWPPGFSYALVLMVCLVIYLPGLGSLELKGEEGRRAMPGIEMVDAGDWLVPRVGGRPYYRKPPLINWVAGASVKLMGRRDEWAIRLPSALGMLALALATLAWSRPALGRTGAFCASIFVVTNIGAMEKGRLIEIEALYISSTGLAVLWWLRGWSRQGPEEQLWSRWLGAGFWLGLGLLLKGPVHILFFYAVVIAVLSCAGELRELRRPAHLAGLALALVIFALWAVPMLQRAAGDGVAQTWTAQFTERLNGGEGDFQFGRYLRNLLFQGWVNFLPWVVLLPLAWRRGVMDGLAPRDLALWRGLRIALSASYLVVMLVPGSAARYTLPLIVPASVLLGLMLREGWQRVPDALPAMWRGVNVILLSVLAVLLVAVAAYRYSTDRSFFWDTLLLFAFVIGIVLERKRVTKQLPHAILGSVAVMAAITLFYVAVVEPRLALNERLRPLAGRIEETLPPGEVLYAFDPDSQPAFFYLARPPRYVLNALDLPDAAKFVFVPEEFLPRLREGNRWDVAQELIRYVDRGGRVLLLVHVKRLT